MTVAARLDLLTEAEAAKELHVCARTMRRLRKSGALRYIAVTDRTILYRPEDLAAFVEQRAQVDHAPATRKKVRAIRKVGDGSNIVSFTARRAQQGGKR